MRDVDESGGPSSQVLAAPQYDMPPSDLVDETEKLLLTSYLLGMDHASTDISLADPGENIVPLTFQEAASFMKSRVPLTKSEWKKLEPELRFRAFTVASLSEPDLIERVRQRTIAVIEKGTPLSEYWTAVTIEDLAGVSSKSPWYWETVYRTNVQTAYNAGRAAQFSKEQPEYLEFVGIEDVRQTDICRERSGTILPASHPFWKSNWPPLHFNCRSTVRSVYQEEVDQLRTAGQSSGTPSQADLPQGQPSRGFGGNPIETGSFYRLTPKILERAGQYGIRGMIEEYGRSLGLTDFSLPASTAVGESAEKANEETNAEDKVPQFANIREAEKWILDHNLADECSFKGSDVRIVQEWIVGIKEELDQYPQARANMQFFGTIQERNTRLRSALVEEYFKAYIKHGYSQEVSERQAKKHADHWMRTSGIIPRAGEIAHHCRLEGFKGITINNRYSNDYEALKLVAENGVAKGHFPAMTGTVASIERHEAGHMLDEVSGFSSSDALLQYWNSLKPSEIREGLSGYATSSVKEFIAEAWSEYRISPSPRPIAAKVAKMLIEKFEEK
jgi:SPP1 gp7 family putative phage head morphogenesis protein